MGKPKLTVKDAPRTYYRSVFSPDTLMRQRIESILAGNGDPAPNTSGLPMIDVMMEALAKGEPNPYAMVNDDGSKRRTPRKIEEYPIVRSVATALVALF